MDTAILKVLHGQDLFLEVKGILLLIGHLC